MKLNKLFAIVTILALVVIVGCSPAADGPTVADSPSTSDGESSAALEGVDTANALYEDLEPIDIASFDKAPVITDFVPAACNLSGTKEDGTPWKIAWSSLNNAEESLATFTALMEEMAAEYGFELITFDAQSDPQKQTNDVNSAITQGCDALIIAPIDPSSQNAVMKKAREAGLVVVNVQNLTAEEDAFDIYVGPNDVIAGQQAASLLLDMMPEGGKIVLVDGNPGETCQINRAQGFIGVMQQYPQFEILEQQGALHWSTAEAMNIMESYMSKYPEIDAVFCQWDIGAAACIQAAETAGRADEMIFVGVDGVQAALDAIAAGGTFKGTSMQPVEDNAQIQVLATLAALNGDGDKIEKLCYVPNIVITERNAGNFEAPW